MRKRRTYAEKDKLLRKYARLNRITKIEFRQLLMFSKDKNSNIRYDVASILSNVRNKASKQLLLRLANDKNALVRTEAYDSLAGFAFTDVEEFLENSIEKEKDGLACSYAIRSWTEIVSELYDEHDHDIEYINMILKKSKVRKSEHCMLECFYALYRFGDKEQLIEILNLFNSNDACIRYAVYETLKVIVNCENRAMIIEALEKRLIAEELMGWREEMLPFWKKLIIEETLEITK